MKKNFFIIIMCFGLLFSLNAESLALQINMPLNNVKTIYGIEQTTYIAEPYPKEDWDLICYHYDYFDLYAYRCQSTVNRICIYADKYLVLIDNNYIHCGQSKNNIEKAFGPGSYEGKDKNGNDIYYYALTNFRELECFYNDNNILCSFYYGYVNPE